MKRTISGMLGILPSDRFNVMVEALWERLFKLLVSSMMTGYTLRNAEFRLSIEKILEKIENHHNEEEHLEKDENRDISSNNPDNLQSSGRTSSSCQLTGRDPLLFDSFKGEEVPASEDINYECLGELSPEAKECICNLKTRLSALEKHLHEMRRKNSALQMQQFVGEEKNDLLDYLRSLQPEKVVELSEPTSPEVHEIVHSIAHGLLATLSPKMHSKPPLESDGIHGGTVSVGKDDRTEMLENASLHLQPLIAVPRDYLARLLFWCLLLGHHLRGLEHRLELMQLLTVDGRT
ncbi:hypothetical protein HPP92_016933 [Vanilla planifolia]|uniref:Uncharacterized protein n=1 Tax=Vanilla planifolia TaxID=51239 RepID=A0A835USJ3_VANPL|nr:hypothetical protein HPP92_016933 [Vanilla planifolia]